MPLWNATKNFTFRYVLRPEVHFIKVKCQFLHLNAKILAFKKLIFGILNSSFWHFKYQFKQYKCYQFRVLRNLRIDIKDRLEEYSQSIEIDIHDCTQSQKYLNSQCIFFIWEITQRISGYNLMRINPPRRSYSLIRNIYAIPSYFAILSVGFLLIEWNKWVTFFRWIHHV